MACCAAPMLRCSTSSAARAPSPRYAPAERSGCWSGRDRGPLLQGSTITGMTALGVSLLFVGAFLILLEAHVPTLGVLGGPGVLALAAGAVLAVLGLGGGVILGVVAGLLLAGAAGGVLAVTVGKGVAVRRRYVRAGPESLIGHLGVVRSWD